MADRKVNGWTIYERIAFNILNFDFGGYDPNQAKQLVQEGKCRWVLGPVQTLMLVDKDYELGFHEEFLRESPDGGYEVEKWSVHKGSGDGD